MGLEILAVDELNAKKLPCNHANLADLIDHTDHTDHADHVDDADMLSTHVTCALKNFNCKHFQSYSIGSINDRYMQGGDL